jgi:hypothetical protein
MEIGETLIWRNEAASSNAWPERRRRSFTWQFCNICYFGAGYGKSALVPRCRIGHCGCLSSMASGSISNTNGIAFRSRQYQRALTGTQVLGKSVDTMDV